MLSAYTFSDYAGDIFEKLKNRDYRKKYFNTRSNVKKIKMAIECSRNAFILTFRLSDSLVAQKETLPIIEGISAGGQLIKLG